MSFTSAIISKLKAVPELAHAVDKIDLLAKDAKFVEALDALGKNLDGADALPGDLGASKDAVLKLRTEIKAALRTSEMADNIDLRGGAEKVFLDTLVESLPAAKQTEFKLAYAKAIDSSLPPIPGAAAKTADAPAPAPAPAAAAAKQEPVDAPAAKPAEKNDFAEQAKIQKDLAFRESEKTKFDKMATEWAEGRGSKIPQVANSFKDIMDGNGTLEDQILSLRSLKKASKAPDGGDATPGEFAGYVQRANMDSEGLKEGFKWIEDLKTDKMSDAMKELHKNAIQPMKDSAGNPVHQVAWDYSDPTRVTGKITDKEMYRVDGETFEKLYRYSDERVNRYKLDFNKTDAEGEAIRGQPYTMEERYARTRKYFAPTANLDIANIAEYTPLDKNGNALLNADGSEVKNLVPPTVRIGPGVFGNVKRGDKMLRGEYDEIIDTVLKTKVYDRFVERKVNDLVALQREIENNPAKFNEITAKIDKILEGDVQGVTLLSVSQDQNYSKVVKDRMAEAAKGTETGADATTPAAKSTKTALERLQAKELTDPRLINELRFELQLPALAKRYHETMLSIEKMEQKVQSGTVPFNTIQDEVNKLVKNTEGGPSLEEMVQNKAFMEYLQKQKSGKGASKSGDLGATDVEPPPQSLIDDLKDGKVDSLSHITGLNAHLRGSALEKLMITRVSELQNYYEVTMNKPGIYSANPEKFDAIFNGDANGPGLVLLSKDPTLQKYLSDKAEVAEKSAKVKAQNGGRGFDTLEDDSVQGIKSNAFHANGSNTPLAILDRMANGKPFTQQEIKHVRQHLEPVLVQKGNPAAENVAGKGTLFSNAIRALKPDPNKAPSEFRHRQDLVAAGRGEKLPSLQRAEWYGQARRAILGTVGVALGAVSLGSLHMGYDPLADGPFGTISRNLAAVVPGVPWADNPGVTDGFYTYILEKRLENSDDDGTRIEKARSLKNIATIQEVLAKVEPKLISGTAAKDKADAVKNAAEVEKEQVDVQAGLQQGLLDAGARSMYSSRSMQPGEISMGDIKRDLRDMFNESSINMDQKNNLVKLFEQTANGPGLSKSEFENAINKIDDVQLRSVIEAQMAAKWGPQMTP